MMTNDQIRDELLALRAHGITARIIAQTARITPEYLSMIANGHVARPSGYVLEALARAMAAARSLVDDDPNI